MKPSMFNIAIQIDDNHKAVYNTLSQQYMVFPNEIAECLTGHIKGKASVIRIVSKASLAQILLSRGILICDDDELQSFVFRHNQDKFANKKAYFVIFPTRACNFVCDYCPQNAITFDRQKSMSKVMVSRVISFIKKILEWNKIKVFAVALFGGEPLLNVDACYHIMHTLRSYADKDKLRVQFSVTTNGYHLAEKYVEKILLYPAVFHVTMEGEKIIHDNIRKTREGKGSYDKILEGISKLVVRNIGVGIRLHADRLSAKGLSHILDDLLKSGLTAKSKAAIYITSIVHQFCSETPITQRLAAAARGAVLSRVVSGHPLEPLFEWGIFKPSVALRTTNLGCRFQSNTSFAIDSDGSLFKCPEFYNATRGEEPLRIGHIDENGEPAWLPTYYEILSHRHLENSPCGTCAYLPVCGGGCLMQEPWKNTDACKGRIDWYKAYFTEYLIRNKTNKDHETGLFAENHC